jgi:hypothetical protein
VLALGSDIALDAEGAASGRFAGFHALVEWQS